MKLIYVKYSLICLFWGIQIISAQSVDPIWDSSAQKKPAQNIKIFGDSISKGANSEGDDIELQYQYNTLLAAWLGVHQINSSISGSTLTYQPQSYRDYMFGIYEEELLTGSNDDYVVIFLGTNDINYIYPWRTGWDQAVAEEFFNHYKTILESLIAYGYESSRIILVTPYLYNLYDENFLRAQRYIRDTVNNLSQAYNCVFVDLWNMIHDRIGTTTWTHEYYIDNIHPNIAGHEVIFAYVKESIQDYQNKKLTDPQRLRDEADYTNKVWCAFDAAVDGDGSYFSPRNTFYGIGTYLPDTVYLLKRGTEEVAPTWNFEHVFDDVAIAAYGDGPKPVLRGNEGYIPLIFSYDTQGALLKDVRITGKYSGHNSPLIRIRGDDNNDVQIAYSEIIGDSSGTLPVRLLSGRANGCIFHHNEWAYAFDDAIEWGYGNASGSVFTFNYIHHANQEWLTDQAGSQGDGMQMESGSSYIGEFGGLYFANNYIDRSDTGRKFCLIINGNDGTSRALTLLNNTFVVPQSTTYGGAGCYVAIDEPTGSIFKGNLFLNANMYGLYTWNGVFEDILHNVSIGPRPLSNISTDDTNIRFDDLAQLNSHLDANPTLSYGAMITPETFWNPGTNSDACAEMSVTGTVDGTTISLTIAGGTAPYNYLWSHHAVIQNVSNLNVGAYRVLVSDVHGCRKEAIFNISPYDSWATAYPAGARDPADMPDNDGIPNLIKYAAGLEAGMAHPATALFSSFLQTNQSRAATLVMTYHKAPEVTDARLYAIQSGSLTNPVSAWTTNGLSTTITSNTNAEGRVEWKVEMPCTNTAAFIGLQAEIVE